MRYRPRSPAFAGLFLLVIAAGIGLWLATERWQWVVTLPVVLLVLLDLRLATDDRMLRDNAPPSVRNATTGTLPVERVADSAGRVVLLAGLVAWAWTGHWWLALVGATVGLGTLVATTIRQGRRRTAA